MKQSIADKITLLNNVTLESLGEHNKLKIIQKFTEASINMMVADFGFAWWKRNIEDEYQLVYRSESLPYNPNPPRKRGGNYKARVTGEPFFVEDTSKENYSKQYDVRPYMKSYVIIPIVYENNFYGNIVLCYTKLKKFSSEDRSIASTLGNSLAQALTISRLYNNLKNFQETLDNSLDSIFIFEPQSLKMKYVNNGAEAFTGQSKEALLKLSLHDIISGLSKTELQEKIDEIAQNKATSHVRFESVLNHLVKGKIPVEVYLQLVKQQDFSGEVLVFVRDISERKRTENTIRKMAYYDALTGLPNRSLLTQRLAEVQAQSEKKRNMFALFFIDLDRFKIINDIYGHPTGDLLLMQVAKRMQKAIPRKATLSRMGGDEFLVLLPDLDTIDEAQACAESILGVFSDFFDLNGQEIYSNGSVGFAIYPLHGVDHGTLLKNADLALSRAKEYGGGNFQQFTMGLPLFYTMQPKLQNQLRLAIKNKELVLHYQPIIHTKAKRIVGCEALIRWNHPEMGLLMPGAFIEQAEESGLIVDIGHWVVDEVCRQIKVWQSMGKTVPPVSLNISPRELLKPSLAQDIEACLSKYSIKPSQLKLELTETFLMKNVDLSISILKQLRILGLQILIDDFGTGYASLNYLKLMPINAVKIDKTFVHGVLEGNQDAALTSAIISISHELGLEVVGEGVENEEQLTFLKNANCNYAQGNYLHSPLEAKDFIKLLK